MMHLIEKINVLRNKIDLLDEQMLDLLVQRLSVSREIGKINKHINTNTKSWIWGFWLQMGAGKV